jgi:2-polyprenyl-3-methyl-5-hydroxy-6-metoxy-1,4-benzoquinol methylase
MGNILDRSDLSRKALRSFYNDPVNYPWGFETVTTFNDPLDVRRLTVICDLLVSLKPKMILDAGCGGGFVVKNLVDRSFNVYGMDFSINLLKAACLKNKLGDMLCADISNTPFKSSTFDCVVCSEVLEHIPDIEAAVDELFRILSVDGKLIVTVPNLSMFDSIEGKFAFVSKILKVVNFTRRVFGLKPVFSLGYDPHLHRKMVWEWKELLESHGFIVIHDHALLISPYIPHALPSLKKIEMKIYGSKLFARIQRLFEGKVADLWPFKYTGQCHLFLCTKIDA